MEWYGSVENRMDEGKQVGALRVGMGATEMMYSDREPYTVQKVVSPSRVIVTKDKWTRVDSNGRSECQEYACESVPLTVGEKKRRCTHMLFMQIGTDRCDDRGETDGCGGCKWRSGGGLRPSPYASRMPFSSSSSVITPAATSSSRVRARPSLS